MKTFEEFIAERTELESLSKEEQQQYYDEYCEVGEFSLTESEF